MGKGDDGLPRAPSWQEVLLVCKACGKRGSGPKKLKAKAVVSEARRLLRASRPRPRVLLTGCLGLCPKSAIAVAKVGGEPGRARIVAVPSIKHLGTLLPLLGAPPAAPGARKGPASTASRASGISAADVASVLPPPQSPTAPTDRPAPGSADD